LQADELANGSRNQQSARNKMVLEISENLIGAFVVGVLLT
jgi:F0F1-type ATP synthase assembly protein I